MWVVLNSKSTSWNPVERLIFPAPAASYDLTSFPEELILIPRADGEQVPCLLLPFRHARFLIIYFHANAEDLGLCYSFCKIMRDLFQVHVLAVEYPGYGVCRGKTDEDGIMANAMAAIRFVRETLHWPCDGIKLFGRSLGTGPTVALATQYEVAGVILVSPFTSIRDLFRSQVGMLAEFVSDRFRNQELASKIESPTLIVHGQQDTLIPLEHGKLVYENLSTRKMMVCPATMGHNTSLLKSIGTFVLPMTQFFSLPDYTFEDIQVPEWVYPRRLGQPPPSIKQEQQPQQEQQPPPRSKEKNAHGVPAIKGLSNLSNLRAGAGGPAGAAVGAPVRQPLSEEEEANAARRPRLSPRAPPPGSAAVAQTSSGPSLGARGGNLVSTGTGFMVSRGYDFKGPKTARTSSQGPAPRPATEDIARPLTAREPLTKASAASANASTDEEDVMAAIDSRITWMVESTGILKKREERPSLLSPARDGNGRGNFTPRLTNLISVDAPSVPGPESFAL